MFGYHPMLIFLVMSVGYMGSYGADEALSAISLATSPISSSSFTESDLDNISEFVEGSQLYGPKCTDEISSAELIREIKDGSNKAFRNICINGDVDLSGLNIVQNIEITDSIINGSLNFSNSQFSMDVNFRGTTIRGDSNFYRSNFLKNADFSSVKFNQSANFWQAQFDNYTIFRNSEFEESANFQQAQFFENANFWQAHFLGSANFLRAQFGQNAYFIGSNFEENAVFQEAQFNKDVNFGQVRFDGDARFQDAQFSKRTFFEGAVFRKKLYLTGAEFNRINAHWNSIRDCLLCDDVVYHALVNNYRDLGWFEDADNCYYDFKRMSHSREPLSWATLPSKALDNLFWLSCGYGVRPAYLLLISANFIILIGIIFWRGNGIRKVTCPIGGCPINYGGGSLLIDSPHTYRTSPIDALYFSAMVFFSAPSDFKPKGRYRYLVIFERIMGWILLGLFIILLVKVTVR